jgi:hypothetical protein
MLDVEELQAFATEEVSLKERGHSVDNEGPDVSHSSLLGNFVISKADFPLRWTVLAAL